MPLYHRLGKLPAKRHQVFENPQGGIYYEELVGNKGFSGPSSLLYHLRMPTEVRDIEPIGDVTFQPADDTTLRHRHLRTGEIAPASSAVLDRTPLLFNSDCQLSFVRPTKTDDFFYRNGQFDELVYLAKGSGTLHSQYGTLVVRSGDYVVIPRGTLHRFDLTDEPQLLVLETVGNLRTPKRYRNEHGQLIEGAPYSERDIRRPEELPVFDETGAFPVVVKRDHSLLRYTLGHHPFDAVGWDGFYYPWAFSIHDFEPKVGRFHLPPPVHQTFECDGLVVCSFCPRPFDFDERAVPAPYYHSNAMSDEVIYYASDEFMSRKGVAFGSITLHPDGIPHGPQPGKMEASIGVKWTDELAVMVDTFRPLQRAAAVASIEDESYWSSWQGD